MKQGIKAILKSIAEAILILLVCAGVLYVGKKLEAPWSGIVPLAGLLLLFGVPALLKRKKRTVQESEAEQCPTEPRKADAALIFLFVHHVLSGALYQVTRRGDGYAFLKVGNEFTGLREEMLTEAPLSEETAAALQTKQYQLWDSEISGCEIRMRRSIASQFQNCGTVSFCLDSGKKKKYVMLGALSKETVEAFFAPIRQRVVWLERGARWDRVHEKDRAFAAWRMEGQKPELYRKLKIVRTALKVFSAVVALCCLFIAQPYWLWSLLTVLCFLLTIALQIAFPAYFSLIQTEQESLTKTGTKCIGLLDALLFSGAGALLRTTLDFNYVSYMQLGIALLLFVCILMTLLLVRCKELRMRVGSVALVFLALLLFSGGILAQLNYLLDFEEPRLETVTVTCKEENKTKGPVEHLCTIVTGEGERLTLRVDAKTYSALSPGDAASFAVYRGGLGIGYRELYEME